MIYILGYRRTPSLVTVHPSVLAQILDHQSRKPAEQPRVIGTLLGVRSSETGSTGSSSEIEIRNCFALPHVETDKEVAVDMEYHRSMMNLLGSGREVLVGWYVAAPCISVLVTWNDTDSFYALPRRYSSSPDITPYSALIQNFFDGETGSSTPAVHLTFDTNLSQENVDSSLSVKAYVAREVGSAPKPENAVFLPIPCSIKYQLTEKAGRKLQLASV
jgi:translation initiation factor 3 subunit F